MIEIQSSPQGNSLIVSLTGRLDTATAPVFDRQVQEDVTASDKKRVVLDFSKLVYISSLGISSVLIIAKTINQRGGELVLCGLTGIVREVFQITGLTSVFKVFPTADAALEQN
jgi:anti-anti-sigma factor